MWLLTFRSAGLSHVRFLLPGPAPFAVTPDFLPAPGRRLVTLPLPSLSPFVLGLEVYSFY